MQIIANFLKKKDTIKQGMTSLFWGFQCLTLFQLMRSPVEQLSSPERSTAWLLFMHFENEVQTEIE